VRAIRYKSQIALVLGLTWILGASGSTAEDSRQVNPLLADNWKHQESGASLQVEPAGSFVITSAGGKELLSGTIESACWESVGWSPGSLVEALVLRVEVAGVEWLISGYFSYGEGDPPGLSLYPSGVYQESFFQAFGHSRDSGRLWLEGTGPWGK